MDEPFIGAMVAKHGAMLGGEDGVRDRIAAALGHKQRQRYTDLQAYVRNWLRGDAERLQAVAARVGKPNGRGNLRPVGPSRQHPDDAAGTEGLFERMAARTAAGVGG